jgi:Rrf2 family protein
MSRRSTRFPIALHVLVSLTLRREWLSSESLAWSIGANPSMVRRILASLNRAGLLRSRAGPTGGVQLARDPREITLLEVHRAVGVRPSVAVHAPNPECPLGAVVGEPLQTVLDQATTAADRVLGQRTVYELAMLSRRRMRHRSDDSA